MWVLRARAAIARVYGKDAPEVELWCPKSVNEPATLDPRTRILTRLPALERLLGILAISTSADKIFIGHGRSSEWLKLRSFISDTLALPCDEFNIEPTAGLQTGTRIETMLNSARMAFLVLTPEDRHANESMHARENVIHEVGLFQAKLGPMRAIVLLENGCERFSNLDGLTTINFPANDLLARSEDIRGVLRREQVLGSTS
jgi:predicted nucleotide-binding protein